MPLASLLALASLAAPGLWSAHDPFVGDWKLDVSRSVIVDQMVVETPRPDTFTFRFEGAPAETIRADGTDQPGLSGTTLSVKVKDSHTLSVVRKQGDHVLVSAHWTLSADGRSLRDSFTDLQPDGSTIAIPYVYRRMQGGRGFTGVWESTTKPIGLKVELQIRPHESGGLSFVTQGSAKNVTFDGQDHPVSQAPGSVTASGRRQGPRALTYTERTGGKVVATRALSLSSDGRTLTINLRKAVQMTAERLVFERE
jgi:hypothetical protein